MVLLESKYHWIDTLFDWCVQTIKDFGQAFGMNYNEANILIFCIVLPLLFLFFMVLALLNTKYKSKILKRITWVSVIITLLSPFLLWFLASFLQFLLQYEQYGYFVDHASSNTDIVIGTINIFLIFILLPTAVSALLIFALVKTGFWLHQKFNKHNTYDGDRKE